MSKLKSLISSSSTGRKSQQNCTDTQHIDWSRSTDTTSKEDLTSRVLQSKVELAAVKSALKEEFIGLDPVIDEIVTLVSPWYVFPEYQTRPVIINLWGMTGTGKTALLRGSWRKLASRVTKSVN
jgi:Cdc6-like AAA superfamily ATPase